MRPSEWRFLHSTFRIVVWALTCGVVAPTGAYAEVALHVIAHHDDDLYFINPALTQSIVSGDPSWTVYVTAADASRRPPQPPSGSGACAGLTYHWQCRERGMQAAYAQMAGVADAWTAPPLLVAGRSLEHRVLSASPNVHLVYLRIESPSEVADEVPTGTLERLWDGRAFQLSTIEDSIGQPESFFTREQLIDVLAQLISFIQPDVLRTLDPSCVPEAGGPVDSCTNAGAYYFTTVWSGNDHAEHVGAARFALAAHARSPGERRVRWYRTYNTVDEPVNVSATEEANSAATNAVYLLHDAGGGPNGWNGREIALGDMDLASGQIALQDSAPIDPENDDCLEVVSGAVPGSPVILSPCAGLDRQIFEAAPRFIRHLGLCLTTHPASGATVEICDGGAEQRWTWWTGRAIRNGQGRCLGVATGSVAAVACAAGEAVWELRATPAAAASSGNDFSGLEFGTDPARYLSLRLGDVNGDGRDDACARRNDGVYCALTNIGGTFGTATRWHTNFSDVNGWGDVQYGSTIMLGDLDGDGDEDLCGRGTAGLWCARSNGANAFGTITLWTTVFGNAWGGGQSGVYGSLRMGDVDGDGDVDVCGYRVTGQNDLVCVRSNGSAFDQAETTWFAGWSLGLPPAQQGQSLMLGDIDGDGSDDVCERGSTSVFCALSSPSTSSFVHAAGRSLANFSDVQGWASLEAYWHSMRLADLNGDGQADLCGRGGRGVLCSLSIDGRFSKEVHHLVPGFRDVLGFSATERGATLQLGDIDGDGTADFCAAGASALECARLPVPEPDGTLALVAGVLWLLALSGSRRPGVAFFGIGRTLFTRIDLGR